MDSFRFILLALALGAMSFFGVRWLTAPAAAPLAASQVAATVGSRVASEAPSAKKKDDEAERAALREAVLDAASDLLKDPCRAGYKFRYVQAATDYAEAWLKLAPCVAKNTCSNATSAQLDRAQKAFGTSVDRKVRTAMTDVHMTGEIQGSDFPPSTISLMASLASDPSLMSASPDAARLEAQGDLVRSHFHHVSRCK